MRAVVQRVLNAGVTVDGECVGRIGRGYLVLLGVGHGDTRAEADKLWGKLRGLRINEDENGKTNLALADVDGEVLVVSQFTLFADCRHGRRPSFTDAGAVHLPSSWTPTIFRLRGFTKPRNNWSCEVVVWYVFGTGLI